MVIGGYRVGPLLRATGREILDDRVPTLAAQTAYYFFFSLFPLLLFLTPLVGLVADERTIMHFVETQLAAMVGPQAFAPVRAAIESAVFAESAPGIMSMGALLAAWSGSNIFGSLMAALNTAYDVTEERPWWKQQLVRLAMFLVAALTLLVATVVMLGGEDVARWLATNLGMRGTGQRVWSVAQFPLAFAFIVALAFLVFYFLPNVRQDWRKVLVAALVTTVLWLAATLLFRVYVQNFASFNRTYGTIGGIIALLTWMYYSMFVLLSGGELASELAHGTGAVRPLDGAVYRGRIVTDRPPGRPSIPGASGPRSPSDE
jgi:membrane protein